MRINLSEQVALGKTGVRISRIVIGTSGEMGGFRRPPDQEGMRHAERARMQRFGRCLTYDTANMYGAGLALENLGNVIPELGMQEHAVVINKPGWVIIPPIPGVDNDIFERGDGGEQLWFGLAQTIRYAQNREQMERSIDQAQQLLGEGIQAPLASAHDLHKLERFINQAKTGGLNLFLGDPPTMDAEEMIFGELLPALVAKKEAGVLKGIGVGMGNLELIRRIIEEVKLDYVMLANEFSIFRHDEERSAFLDELHKAGIGVIVAAPFHAAWILGAGEQIDGFIKPSEEDLQWREKFLSVCSEADVSPAAAAIQFCFSHPGTTAVAPGAGSAKHIQSNFPIAREVSPGKHEDLQIPTEVWAKLIETGVIHEDYPYKEVLLSSL